MNEQYGLAESKGMPAILNEAITSENIEMAGEYLDKMSVEQVTELLSPMLIQEADLGPLDIKVIRVKAHKLLNEGKDGGITLQEALIQACVKRVDAKPLVKSASGLEVGVLDTKSGILTPVKDWRTARREMRERGQQQQQSQ